ncbi:MAG: hypothetical protein HQL13_08475, partial [Candidatus Omnitrophica bacterium]|nr:hypothetical protein [Candidatus Omnitrophota bacterium]
MPIDKIQKRNGEIVDFDRERIAQAIRKAANATKKTSTHPLEIDSEFIPELVDEIIAELKNRYGHLERVPNIENIQDIVEQKLIEAKHFEIARNYILYRAKRSQVRAEEKIQDLQKIEKNLLQVTKRDGTLEKFSQEKIKEISLWAAKEYESSCSFEEMYERLKLTIVDNLATTQIMKNMRKVCLDLISVHNIHWQHVAGRLYIMDLYKAACRKRQISLDEIYSPRAFKDHFDHYIKIGRYYKDFYNYYSAEDILEAAKAINKQRDLSYIYSTVLAFDRRYLLNPNKEIRELPQEMYMAIALFLAIPEEPSQRLKVAKKIYDITSSQKLSLPTPTLLNARTNFHQLSSCFKLNVNDDLRAIYHSLENMAQISKFGGGVGVYLGHIRAKGS